MGDQNIEGGSRTWEDQDGLLQDVFKPEDMQVLAIDANAVSLKYLVTLLQKSQYKVTWTTVAAEALKILRENKNMYDIVITDVVRLDMDGFNLLKTIGLQMDIPVIMVSAEDSRSSIIKGIRHGARDYLIKPVRMQEIRNIWQHVVRKKLSDRSCEKSNVAKEAITLEQPRPNPIRILEENEIENGDIKDGCKGKVATSSGKKPRVTWTPDLHSKFVDAIQLLEAQNENTYPKRILEIMDVKWLSRENVASHLQKFRCVWRKQKAGDKQCNNRSSEMHIGFGDNIPSSSNNICVGTKVDVDPIPSTAILSHSQLLPQNPSYPTLANWQKLITCGTSRNFSSSPSEAISNCLPATAHVYPLPASFNPPSVVPGRALTTFGDFLVSAATGTAHSSLQLQPVAGCNRYGYGNHVSYGREATHCANKCHNIPQPTEHLVINDEAKVLGDEEIREMVNQFNRDGAPSL